MPRYSKYRYKKQHSKKNKTYRKSKKGKQTRTHKPKCYLFNGGNCASCGTITSPLLLNHSGGSNVIPLNNAIGTSHDPITPSNIVSTSNLPNMSSGGSGKKMKGGSITDFLLGATTGANVNLPLALGSTTNAPSSVNLLSGLSITNPATHVQPIDRTNLLV